MQYYCCLVCSLLNSLLIFPEHKALAFVDIIWKYHKYDHYYAFLWFSGFFKERKFSPLSWGTLIVLIITIILLLVVMVAPGWGYTREIRGREVRLYKTGSLSYTHLNCSYRSHRKL